MDDREAEIREIELKSENLLVASNASFLTSGSHGRASEVASGSNAAPA